MGGQRCCSNVLCYVVLSLLVFINPSGAISLHRTGVNEAIKSSDTLDCNVVEEIFLLKNITAQVHPVPMNGSGLCRSGPSCCTPEMEVTLQKTVTKELHNLLHHNFQSIHGMLAFTSSTIQEEVRKLVEDSLSRTHYVFAEAYKSMWSQSQGPISQLYGALLTYLENKNLTSPLVNIPTEEAEGLEGAVKAFFRDMFPLVYHQAVLHLPGGEFTQSFQTCLKNEIERINPFGDFPGKLARETSKAFESIRVFIEALNLGIEVLNGTDRVMSRMGDNTDTCRDALVRLHYCPRCLGLSTKVKPCNDYCLNVIRGCLTQQQTTELDLPWSNFLEETEKLARMLHSTEEVEKLLQDLPSSISEALMYTSMNGPGIQKEVKKACGTREIVPAKSIPAASENRGRREVTKTPPKTEMSALSATLVSFLESSTKARGLYANLAEALCSDESFAETRATDECWNGHRIGEYTKVLLRAGVDAQKYNPELEWREITPDPTIRQLSDKLRNMRMVILTQFGQQSSLKSYNSYIEGSGSGWKQGYDDDPEEPWTDQGSGSGDSPHSPGGKIHTYDDGPKIHRDHPGGQDSNYGRSEPDSSSSLVFSSTVLISSVLIVILFR